MNDYKFGNFLCMLREKKGLTQADIASSLGVTPAAVSKWENGSSKPRVEVLFQLAQMLDVRAEELMAGHYIESETLDAEAVKTINERYDYLRRVDQYNSAGVKFRRLLAWIIDWNLIGFCVMLALSVYSVVFEDAISRDVQPIWLGMFAIMLMYPICFILRDSLFKGRSLGKRIMRLTVLDRQTGFTAKFGKCAVRNLFFFVFHIDGVVMLISGESIGDRIAHTVVVPKKALDTGSSSVGDISTINSYKPPRPRNTKRTVFIVIGVIVLFFVLIFTIVSIALASVKNNEEYKLAYEYLVESETFKELGVNESKIRFNRYSSNIYTEEGGDTVIQNVQMGFNIKMRAYNVVCHKKNGVWEVCTECTSFD